MVDGPGDVSLGDERTTDTTDAELFEERKPRRPLTDEVEKNGNGSKRK